MRGRGEDESWDFYLTELGQARASIAVDLNVARLAPLPGRDKLLLVRVSLRQPGADGMAGVEETEPLGAIEEALSDALDERCGATLVGRLTTSGYREWFFYGTSTAELPAAVSAALAAHPGYKASYRSAVEADWTTFFEVLMPDPDEFSWMTDRRVVEQLKEAGDMPSAPRPVDHYLLFPDQASLERFVAERRPEGFQDFDAHLGEEGEWCVRLVRQDAVELEHIHEVTSQLRRQAQAARGVYDGWGAPIVRPN